MAEIENGGGKSQIDLYELAQMWGEQTGVDLVQAVGSLGGNDTGRDKVHGDESLDWVDEEVEVLLEELPDWCREWVESGGGVWFGKDGHWYVETILVKAAWKIDEKGENGAVKGMYDPLRLLRLGMDPKVKTYRASEALVDSRGVLGSQTVMTLIDGLRVMQELGKKRPPLLSMELPEAFRKRMEEDLAIEGGNDNGGRIDWLNWPEVEEMLNQCGVISDDDMSEIHQGLVDVGTSVLSRQSLRERGAHLGAVETSEGCAAILLVEYLRRLGVGGGGMVVADYLSKRYQKKLVANGGVVDKPENSEEVLGDIEQVPVEDTLELYMRQMGQEPLLTRAEEIWLAMRIELGREAAVKMWDERGMEEEQLNWLVDDGQAARERLGRANTRLVVSVAKRYMGQGLPFPDLIQEGNVGLMRAVDGYDFTRGNRFSTYATWWIRQVIGRAIVDKVRTIRIPKHMSERINEMYEVAQELTQVLGHRPSPEEIAHEMGLPLESVEEMMDMSRHPVALEGPAGEDGDKEFGDFVEDSDTPSPVEAATEHLLKETIGEVLSELTPRQQAILILRFGLGIETEILCRLNLSEGEITEPHTLEEIADKFGLSRERIRQLEKKALGRLRHPRLARYLRDFLDE